MDRTPPFKYVPFLDGLRAVSILLVTTWHSSGPLLTLGGRFSGWSGVDVFFVISGFLITSLLLSEQAAEGRISLKRFYIRRTLRIMPAYYVMLAVVLLMYGRAALEPVGLSAAYLSDFDCAVGDGRTREVPLGHTWSLAIEEQFYLLWPLALLLAGAWSLRWVIAAVAVMIIAKAALILTAADDTLAWQRVYYAFETRADAILIGCGAALLWARPDARARITAGLAGGWTPWLLTGALVLSAYAMSRPAHATWIWCVLHTGHSLLIALLVLALLANPSSSAATQLSRPSLVWLGRISYSLYLWQLIGFQMGRGVADALLGGQEARPLLWGLVADGAGFGIGLTLACLSFYVVEQPFLALKRFWEPRSKRGPDVAVSAPTAAVSHSPSHSLSAAHAPSLAAWSRVPQGHP